MNILMIAPEPFFQPRGTPISVFFRTTALGELGHRTDLLTYPLGESPEIANLTIVRVPNLFRFKRIKIGPSLAKLPLDALLFGRAIVAVMRKRYDLLFTHEEAAFFGLILARLGRLPHIYDMHSSLPQQLDNFQFSKSRLLRRIFAGLERKVLRQADAIIVICKDLQDTVTREGQGDKALLIENVLDFPGPALSGGEADEVRLRVAPNGERIVLYAGNFEPYQGIGLLLDAFAKVAGGSVLLLVGGSGEDLEAMKRKAVVLGLGKRVVFWDRVSPDKVPLFVSLADVLVSPRLSGTNTPLKIYSFLKSGKPLVATNLYTHTQVLDEKISILVEPTAEAMAAGIMTALDSPIAKERAAAARALAEREYTREAYFGRMDRILKMAVAHYAAKKRKA